MHGNQTTISPTVGHITINTRLADVFGHISSYIRTCNLAGIVEQSR